MPGRQQPKGAGGKKLDFSDGGIWIGPKASKLEVQAAKELQTFLYSISQKKLAVRELANGQTDGRPAIIVGTVKSLSELTGGFPEQVARLKKGSNEAFDLHIGTTQRRADRADSRQRADRGAVWRLYLFGKAGHRVLLGRRRVSRHPCSVAGR